MATLVFRTSGRKIKRSQTTQEKILQSIGLKPAEIRREVRWNELKMQVIKLKA